MQTKRIAKNKKSYTYFKIRTRYQAKRRTEEWKKRKRNKKEEKIREQIAIQKHREAPYIKITAPKDFSFINNTDEVLNYFESAREIYWSKKNVDYDVLDIEKITPDTVAVWVALIKERKFSKTGNSAGNSPKNKEAYDLINNSGFPELVTRSDFEKKEHSNLIHRETNDRVQGPVAGVFSEVGMNHTGRKKIELESLYNIIIECMYNTRDHADLDKKGGCKWQLLTYNHPDTKKTSYVFLDLGVGIFESQGTKDYINLILKSIGIKSNLDLVDPLLTGEIKSRIAKDNDLRGKGLREIVDYARTNKDSNLHIISNDIKINVVTGYREKLTRNFRGTMVYWELT